MKAIHELDDLEFAKVFDAIRKKIMDNPLDNFVRAKGLINFRPSPGQIVLLKNVFGQPLDDTTKYHVYVEGQNPEGDFDLESAEFTEVELFKFFTGFDYEFKGKKFNRINLICGRRAGKSTTASIIALFSALKTNWRPYLSKTPVATIAVLSHSVEFSMEILDILRTMVDESPVLSRLRDNSRKDTQYTFHLKIPFLKDDGSVQYSYVAIKVGAASKKTTRGRAVCTLLADEACWWNLDENSKESDVDVFRAIRPALLQFGDQGTIIKLSSPAIKAGVMYDEWNKREEMRAEFIQLKAPSWMMNNILPKEEFQKEYKLDPDGFRTEYRAEFIDSISNFILPEFVDMCVLRGVSFEPPSTSKGVLYSAAIDAAFKKDRFAFALVGHESNRIKTHVIKYWEGSRENPVRAHEVAKYIRTVCAQFGINLVTGDQHSFQPLREIFEEYGLRLEENTFTLPFKRKIYFGLKKLIHNQQIDLLDVPLLHKELKELQVEQTSTGQIRIGHNSTGSDDLSDALAVASYKAMEKAGSGNVANMGEFAGGYDSRVRTDALGRAITAPSVDLLAGYKGFGEAMDNSGDWVKHPDTGKWMTRTEMEQEEEFAPSQGADFIF